MGGAIPRQEVGPVPALVLIGAGALIGFTLLRLRELEVGSIAHSELITNIPQGSLAELTKVECYAAVQTKGKCSSCEGRACIQAITLKNGREPQAVAFHLSPEDHAESVLGINERKISSDDIHEANKQSSSSKHCRGIGLAVNPFGIAINVVHDAPVSVLLVACLSDLQGSCWLLTPASALLLMLL